MIKVLLIDVNCKYSSTGKIIYDLYTAINNGDDIASVCYGRGPLVKESGVFKFGLDWETMLHALLTRITGFTGYFSFFSTRKLISYIKEFKPDVVHIHELHAYFVNISPLLKYLKQNNIKVVWTFHCEFMYTGKCGHAVDCLRFTEECGNCPQLHEYPCSWFFDRTNFMLNHKRKMFANFDNLTIVTPSKWLSNRLKLSFLRNKEVQIIPNGIDTKIFYPRDASSLLKKLEIQENEKIVLAVAPDLFDGNKGGQWIIKLAETMQDRHVRFLLVGVKDTTIEHPNNVMLFSRTADQDELAEFYSVADAFVVCSVRENYPTTCLEAQCCGTPVFGFDTGGTSETSVFPESKFVEYGDVLSLRNALLNAFDFMTADVRRNISELARKKYSKDAQYCRYYSLYKSK